MSTIKVQNIQHTGSSTNAIALASDGTCTANITNNLSNRNLIINGAQQVAQRSAAAVAVSDGSNEGYQTIDRMHFSYGNSAAGAANISQSTDAPTTLGFTKSHKTDVTTANTTSSGSGVIGIKYSIEGQDLRSSGWNHLSASSFLTLSFYFKTTKTGNSKLPIMFRTFHGTTYYYVQNVTVTDPTNWNRYTVTIPGNSNLTINDDNTGGMAIFFSYQTGSDKDTSSEGAWGTTNAYSTSESTNYFDSTSNDMFITGIQLEVDHTGSGKPTDFEHRSISDELMRCYRYYQVIAKGSEGTGGDKSPLVSGQMWGTSDFYGVLPLKTKMRTLPSLDVVNGTNYWQVYNNSTDTCDTLGYNNASPDAITLHLTGNLNGTAYVGGWSRTNNAAAFVAAKAEL